MIEVDRDPLRPGAIVGQLQQKDRRLRVRVPRDGDRAPECRTVACTRAVAANLLKCRRTNHHIDILDLICKTDVDLALAPALTRTVAHQLHHQRVFDV